MNTGLGGDPPCWAHMFDDAILPGPDTVGGEPTVVDLGSTDIRGRAGVVWSLPHGGDLDVNLVRLHADGGIGPHVNDEVDVVISVIAGGGQLVTDGATHDLCGDVLAMVPRGSTREVRAGADGVTYLSIHRRRVGLAIGTNRKDSDDL